MGIQCLVLGAGQEVGKSCVVVTIGNKRIMFDCGMHMGYQDERRYPDFSKISKTGDFTDSITCVIITHFHLDHIGALPYFTEVLGYEGPIYMTYPTKALAPLMLEDYRKVMVDRKGEEEQFSFLQIQQCMKKVTAVDLKETVPVDTDLQIRAYYAGHVLGAAMFYIKVDDNSVVYIGDYNMTPDRHLGAAQIDRLCPDLLITESMYATIVRDSKHAQESKIQSGAEECKMEPADYARFINCLICTLDKLFQHFSIQSQENKHGNFKNFKHGKKQITCCFEIQNNLSSHELLRNGRRQAICQIAALFSAISSTLSAATAAETELQEDYELYKDETNKFSLVVPRDGIKGEEKADGQRSVTAFYPESRPVSNVSVIITGLSADYTRMESFGNVDAFAETLVNSLDRSWKRPPGQAAKLLTAKSKNGMYYVEYSLQKPGESKIHLLSAIGMAQMGLLYSTID